MTETRRKLTTIFSADVQDYSRLMGADEEGTFATLKRYREAMSALIESHGGRVINTWGDGLIADFPSVVEAVRAAIDTQNELAGFNAGRPEEKQMLFRIGINLGDVIEVGDDIYGDGVNIAARLQASAPPGGIVISSTVYDQVRNKLTVGFDFLGPLSVKNIAEAVPSYAIRVGETATGPARPNPRQYDSRPMDDAGHRDREALLMPPGSPRMYGLTLALSIALAAVNLLTWQGHLWAKWPIAVLAILAGLQWSRNQRRFDRRLASLIMLGVGLVLINLLSSSGTFWAAWPLLVIAVIVAFRWFGARR